MMSLIKFIAEAKRANKNTEQKEIGITILDQVLNGDFKNTDEFSKLIRPNGPTIYAFVTDKVKNAIKVGYTDQHPMKRIEQWQEVYGKNEHEVECLGYWSSEEFTQAGERVFFWDHAVHKKIEGRGYKNVKKDEFYKEFVSDKVDEPATIHYSKEFFRKYKDLIQGKLDADEKEELSDKLIEDIIIQMKENIKAGTYDFKIYSFDDEGKTSGKEADKVWEAPKTYNNTKLQEECIDNGVQAIKEGKKNILMAAVMRFGKTHTSYEIIKQAGLKKVIVCSAKADVRTAWRQDINHVHFYKDFVFVEVLDKYKWDITHLKDDKLITEHQNIYEDTNIFETYKDKTIIFFFTLQDLGGSIGDIKAKHKNIFNEEFDLMVVDETHYGSHANTFGQVTKLGERNTDEADDKDAAEEKKLAKEMMDFKDKLNIKYKTILQVSGTPYYILASNEMINEDAAIISKVSYTDMIQARDDWNSQHKNEDRTKSPYFGIPTLIKIGLNLTKDCRKAISNAGMTDSLTELFKLKGGKFKYEKPITSLMKALFGDGTDNTLAFLKNKSIEGNKVCKHTMIVLPRIDACNAMKDLLSSFIKTDEREIINVVGNKPDVKSVDELNKRLLELDNAGKKSIVLTCVRFLTGVSMPCLDSMIYLKNAKSPQEYDQNIFRLCTRYVKKVKEQNGHSPKIVNMKDNVYLIDFNIANMFNMLANSAKMKADVEKDPDPKTIENYMKQDIDAVPIFCESGDEIVGKMKEVSKEDLMKVYVGYNKSKSIADIANDEINRFNELFTNSKFKDIINKIDVVEDKSKINFGDDVNKPGDDEIPVNNVASSSDDTNGDVQAVQHGMTDLADKIKAKELREIRDKFKTIIKNLLCCNLCLETPYTSVEQILADKNNDKFVDQLNDFRISLTDLKNIYNCMNAYFKREFNNLLLKISILASDLSQNDYSKFLSAINGLGKFGQAEVITPPEVVEKMINKLDKSEYTNVESILLVNEKCCEFFSYIYKHFGKNVAKKCKVVPSSELGKQLCVKMLKTIGLNNYINTIIIDLEDNNNDNKIDINDFLKMNNEEFLKEHNNGKKFDLILSNPPYNNGLHESFLYKYFEIADKIITIQPLSWLIAKKQSKKIINKINNFDTYIDTLNGIKEFKDAALIGDTAIQYINTQIKGKIHIYGNEYNKCEDIKTWSYDKYLELFVEKLGNISNSLWDNIKGTGKWDHNFEDNPNENWWCIKIPKIRGNVNRNKNEKQSPDFYTLISNNEEFIKKNKGQYKKLKETPNKRGNLEFLYFAFNTEQELNNFIRYIKTDFARTCLMIVKKGANLHRGEMRYVPWFDFSDEHFSKSSGEIDDWLFKKYNISDEIRKHIGEILPDYYGIRE